MRGNGLHIREAKPDDVPAIVDLLGESLGNTSAEKTEAYWQWKHSDNPFGASLVLLAEDETNIAGIRAFMQWRWQYGDRMYRALRAVDTATHPAYRRRGIFRALTLRAVEQSIEKGFDFVFNTPNKKSRPGYLSMGWNKWRRVPLSVRVERPSSVLGAYLLDKGRPEPLVSNRHRPAEGKLSNWLDQNERPEPRTCTTPIDSNYLRWRYVHCPVADYGAMTSPGSLLLFRMRQTNFGVELRICDWLRSAASGVDSPKEQFDELMQTYRPDYISLPISKDALGQYIRGRYGFWDVSRWTPVITMRSLRRDIDSLPPQSEWDLSTGTMELF